MSSPGRGSCSVSSTTVFGYNSMPAPSIPVTVTARGCWRSADDGGIREDLIAESMLDSSCPSPTLMPKWYAIPKMKRNHGKVKARVIPSLPRFRSPACVTRYRMFNKRNGRRPVILATVVQQVRPLGEEFILGHGDDNMVLDVEALYLMVENQRRRQAVDRAVQEGEVPIPPMASSPRIFLLVFLYSLASGVHSKCLESACAQGEPSVRFPFRLKDHQDESCGYTGFDLSCNNQNRTILTLPALGDFWVYNIDYENETVTIRDTGSCLAGRVLAGFSTSGSTFFGENYWKFTFFNCSLDQGSLPPDFRSASCLDTSNYHVYVGPADSWEAFLFTCHDNWTVSIPVSSPPWSVLPEYLSLKWNGTALCNYCEENDGVCEASFGGYKSSHCTPKSELSRVARIGIILGVAFPWFLCMLGVSCYIREANRGASNSNTPLSPQSTDRQTQLVGMGMDGPTIELYPKSEVGDSGQLPRPSNNTCSICLSEYKPKETLRLIPDCGHYFHAHCIDPWLKRSGSCPLCRNRLE